MKRLVTIATSCGLLASGAGLYHVQYVSNNTAQEDTETLLFHTRPLDEHYLHSYDGSSSIKFNLHSPFLAPPSEDRELILLGYDIMLHTPKHAGQYMGNTLSCVNCHFCAGNTTGGKNGSISLVGVVCTYPRYSERDNRVLTLEDRIQNCFMRSLNGKALPRESRQMKALIHYMDWISQDVKHLKKIPWLGLRKVRSNHTPDPVAGALAYAEYCAPCHGDNGEGSRQAPPVWGDNSFNDGAGMNDIRRLSAFIYHNMPYQNPNLKVEEALDIAAFLTKQKRPHFTPPAPPPPSNGSSSLLRT